VDKEKKFYDALEDIFIGVKVEGLGGYINLLSIKSQYFSDIKLELKKEIEQKLSSMPEFRDELFDKLYTFFNRYFSSSGSIYFNYTPLHQNVYEKVYTNDKEIILFWKTKMLYYVKSEILFQDLDVEVNGRKYFIDTSDLEHSKNDEKKELVFIYSETDSSNKINLKVTYSQRGSKTKEDEIIKAISKKRNINIDKKELQKVIRTFKSQMEYDYFINKDAKKFLEEQFDNWLYQYMFKETLNDLTVQRVNQVKALKEIAYNIIHFISQFENELVKIWNKPKFVLNSNYVLTLSNLSYNLFQEFSSHKNMDQQLKEWKALKYIEDNMDVEDINYNDYPNLPIDTKYFEDLKVKFIEEKERLDSKLDGVLIKSDNYQALNTIKDKYNNVKLIYIDPPYNTEDDEFIYKDKMKHSSWLTMMENRLTLAKEMLGEEGALICQIDYKEVHNLFHLLSDIFGEDNIVQLISLKTSSPAGFKTVNPGPIDVTEYLLFVTKDKSKFPFKKMYTKVNYDDNYNLYIENIEDKPEDWELKKIIDKFYEVNNIKGNFEAKKKWGDSWKTIRDIFIGEFALEHANRIVSKRDPHKPTDKVRALLQESRGTNHVICVERQDKNNLYIYRGGSLSFYSNKLKEIDKELVPTELLTDNWNDISWAGIANEGKVALKNGKKPERLIQRIIEMTTDHKDDIVMDFFAGSATTPAVSHKLNRKWIGVEFGEHFEDITLKRMKNVLQGDQTGISKNVDFNGGGILKYYSLEQYEDTLRNAVYKDENFSVFNANKSPYEQYIFLRDEKLSRAIEKVNNDFAVNLEKIYPEVDLAETFSNLLGKKIISQKDNTLTLENDMKIDLDEIKISLVKPLIRW